MAQAVGVPLVSLESAPVCSLPAHLSHSPCDSQSRTLKPHVGPESGWHEPGRPIAALVNAGVINSRRSCRRKRRRRERRSGGANYSGGRPYVAAAARWPLVLPRPDEPGTSRVSAGDRPLRTRAVSEVHNTERALPDVVHYEPSNSRLALHTESIVERCGLRGNEVRAERLSGVQCVPTMHRSLLQTDRAGSNRSRSAVSNVPLRGLGELGRSIAFQPWRGW